MGFKFFHFFKQTLWARRSLKCWKPNFILFTVPETLGIFCDCLTEMSHNFLSSSREATVDWTFVKWLGKIHQVSKFRRVATSPWRCEEGIFSFMCFRHFYVLAAQWFSVAVVELSSLWANFPLVLPIALLQAFTFAAVFSVAFCAFLLHEWFQAFYISYNATVCEQLNSWHHSL